MMVEDFQISKNFSLSEFIESERADELNIDNTPAQSAVNNLILLVRGFMQPARDLLNSPIDVTSGFRCPALNNAVGGKSNSFHLSGRAADFIVPKMNTRQVFDKLRTSLKYDKLIYEVRKNDVWIHAQWNEGNNRQIAMTARPGADGQMVYTRV